MSNGPDGRPRVGFLVDGDPGTDLMTALYEHDSLGVRLWVPYHAWGDDLRGRWWSQGIMFADDPDRTKHSYNPPNLLDYYDNKGTIGLIGCRSGSTKQRFGAGPSAGLGSIHASFAVEGAEAAKHFVKPNGLRSEIDGLAFWLGYSALRTSITLKKDGTGAAMSTTTTPVDDMKLGRALNLCATARATSSGQQTPEVTYRSQVFLTTFAKAPSEWKDHLALHFSVRNLLRIAAWKPLNFQSHEVASTKETVALGKVEQQLWYPVRTAETSVSAPTWTASDQFLFNYVDIKRAGVGRWLKLVKAYSRGIDPLIRLLDLEGATVDAHTMQLGIAMEAIGYQALIDSGKTPASANSMNVMSRIEFLIAEVGNVVPFKTASFAQDFADSYNSVKHANRAPLPPASKLKLYREGVQLLRGWIGLRLGLERAVLQGRW